MLSIQCSNIRCVRLCFAEEIFAFRVSGWLAGWVCFCVSLWTISFFCLSFQFSPDFELNSCIALAFNLILPMVHGLVLYWGRCIWFVCQGQTFFNTMKITDTKFHAKTRKWFHPSNAQMPGCPAIKNAKFDVWSFEWFDKQHTIMLWMSNWGGVLLEVWGYLFESICSQFIQWSCRLMTMLFFCHRNRCMKLERYYNTAIFTVSVVKINFGLSDRQAIVSCDSLHSHI